MDDRNGQNQSRNIGKQLFPSLTRLAVLTILITVVSVAGPSEAQEISRIWSPQSTAANSNKPLGECYFRRKFTLIKPEEAQLQFTAGDEFELYLNDRLVTRGESYGSASKIDVLSMLRPGVNLVAVKVRHNNSALPGLAMKVRIREAGETRWRSLVTDTSWRSRNQPVEGWTQPGYKDMSWLKAVSLGVTTFEKPVADTTKATVKLQTKPAASESSAGEEDSPTKDNAETKVATKPPVTEDVAQASAANETEAQVVATPFEESNQSNNPPAEQKVVTQPASKPQAVAEASNKKSVSNNNIPATNPAVSSRKVTEPKETATADVAETVATAKTEPPSEPEAEQQPRLEFEINSDFSVQQVLNANETGSVIAMEFNEFGKLFLSRKNGPLLIADLSLPADHPGRIRIACDKVRNCSGILPVNGNVFVTAEGPSGLALYRLTDTDNSGRLQPTRAMMKFTGKASKHGPHGLRLGPDGMIYMVLGNGSRVDKRVSPDSPYQLSCEGDLVERLEDPSGHAAGVKAPGGTVVRCSLDGTKIETFAGGLRNPQDLVFDANGDLFLHDSDNPADIGMPWYRPSALLHVSAGAEFGWRSGWSKFPRSVVDVSPAIVETGSGQTNGMTVYRHLQFPVAFHGSIFTSNETTGEIKSCRVQRQGAGFMGASEDFLRCPSLSITDLSIGEDGAIYFGAIDREAGEGGSKSGVYRILWNGTVPDQMVSFNSDLERVIRHPQPDSVWARQNIAQLKITMGREWAKSIRGVVEEVNNPSKFRVRAMQLMVLYGPTPNPAMLASLAGEQDAEIRNQVARVCATLPDGQAGPLLRNLLMDSEPFVRRSAAESMITLNLEPEWSLLIDMLASDDRVEACVARRLLERTPTGRWKQEVLTTDSKRLFIQGSVALMTKEPELKNAYDVLARGSQFMEGFLNDTDFVDLLRAMQLAIAQGEVDPEQIPGFAVRIANEFPSGSPAINMELVRLLAGLQGADLEGRLEQYLTDEEVSATEKLHAAMLMHAVGGDLTESERLSIVRYLDSVKQAPDVGDSYAGYLRHVVNVCGEELSEPQIDEILARPERYASSVISAFYKLPESLDDETVQAIVNLDTKFIGKQDEESQQIRLGVIAVLAQSGNAKAMEYLRTLWRSEEDRRGDIALGLAQQPEGENWAYLVSSLPVLNDTNAEEVLNGLLAVPRKPRDVRHFRDVVKLAESLESDASTTAVKLLRHWAGESTEAADVEDLTAEIARWQGWCDEQTSTATASAENDSTVTGTLER